MSIFDSLEYNSSLSQLRLKLQPAETRGETHCCQSGFCCWARPGALTQEDLKRIAAHKGISEKEFFLKYCVVDNPGTRTFVPTLRRKHQKAGEYLSTRETYSTETPCVFLTEDSKCEVHDVKPSECKAHQCWGNVEKRPEISWTKEELMNLGWDGEMDSPCLEGNDEDEDEDEDEW
jgi:Fe-S-cluster containining protein